MGQECKTDCNDFNPFCRFDFQENINIFSHLTKIIFSTPPLKISNKIKSVDVNVYPGINTHRGANRSDPKML